MNRTMGLIGLMGLIKSHKSFKSRKFHSCLFSGRPAQGLFALLPIAGAKFISLQRVKHAESFINVASNRKVVDRHPADDAFGIYDVRRAQRHAFLSMEDAQRR